MAELAVLGQRFMSGLENNTYVLTRVRHDGGSNTVEIDQTASGVQVFAVDGQSAPTATLEASGDSSTFLKTVTISGGGSGRVDLVTRHAGNVASVKA